ncbi:MAG TPA: ribonuclease HII [Acidimicrobiia bacterium]|nr:ribonuclease HII [Acidimicrobiia bacterium]
MAVAAKAVRQAGRPRAGKARRSAAPKLHVEQGCFEAGARLVCGIDEVGRGAWAGPVSVGAVVIGPTPRRIQKVRDSKELTPAQREALYPKVVGWALASAVGHASPAECDHLGMTAALRLAAERALASLEADGCVPDRIILDGNHDYLGRPDQVQTVIDGDALCLSVAAASIVAKVTRDRIMAAEAECYPAYDFDSNRGYRSYRHRCALLGYGPTAIHRRSWIYMENLPWVQPPREPTLFS